MRFPFITRSHHEEVVALYRAQLDALTTEKQKLLDHYAVLSHNRAIFEPAQNPASPATDTPTPPPTEDRHLRVVREAMSSGHKSPSAIAKYITAKNQREHEEKRQQLIGVTVDDVVADFDRSVEAAAKEQA